MLTEEEQAYRAALKERGELPEDFRDSWALPKKLQPGGGRKSKAKDKAALRELREGGEDAANEPVGKSEPIYYTEPVAMVAGGAADGDVDAETGDALDDPDSVAGQKERLRRLSDLKCKITDEYMALENPHKDTIAFYDKKLKLIESQEKAAMDQLRLFNKKRLDAENAANQVLIVIEDHTGDTTGSVKVWA